jgi:hypothetical protein
MKKHQRALVSLMTLAAMAVAPALLVAIEGDAEACGGCFIPRENPTVVTDHRMILSIARDHSTLYDQIKYTGAPSAFAWVLPISGEVKVALSADTVFSTLDGLTQTQLLAPPRNCPPRPAACDANNKSSQGTPAYAAGGADSAGVSVITTEVVGPYETVQLQATNPTALHDWLATNGFDVPPEVAPVVDKYVAEKFNFLALKLLPNKGVQDMRPISVTTVGPNVALPLRMVAAGTGATVGITLWVIGEGRYEPQNFASFIIKADDISWDWTLNKSNYTDVRAQKTKDGGGRIWEVESSTAIQRVQLENLVRGRDPAGTTYLDVKDSQGAVTTPAAAVRDADLTTLTNGLDQPRVTRLRADLAHAALDADLVMTAASDQSIISNTRQITKELNQPLCPVYVGCTSTEQAPRDEAAAKSAGSGSAETFSCDAARPPTTSSTWLGLALGTTALFELVRRRSRSSQKR